MRIDGTSWRLAFPSLCLLGLAATSALAQPAGKAADDPLAAAHRFEIAFDQVVAEKVQDGWVDYAALVADPKPLDDWLKSVAEVDWIEVRSWPRLYVVAFYINAYNGSMLRLVRDNYPVSGDNLEAPPNSVLQIENVFKQPLRIARQDVSLDKIEKEIILQDYTEHRAHFALVCGAVGCPKLKNEAYHGANLADELDLAAQMYIRSPQGAHLDMDDRVLYLSRIFDWYRGDFQKLGGIPSLLREIFADMAPVVMFVATHRTMEESRFIRGADFRIEWIPYDWRLNDAAAR